MQTTIGVHEISRLVFISINDINIIYNIKYETSKPKKIKKNAESA